MLGIQPGMLAMDGGTPAFDAIEQATQDYRRTTQDYRRIRKAKRARERAMAQMQRATAAAAQYLDDEVTGEDGEELANACPQCSTRPPSIFLPCAHQFCAPCLQGWTAQQLADSTDPTCPICRTGFNPEPVMRTAPNYQKVQCITSMALYSYLSGLFLGTQWKILKRWWINPLSYKLKGFGAALAAVSLVTIIYAKLHKRHTVNLQEQFIRLVRERRASIDFLGDHIQVRELSDEERNARPRPEPFGMLVNGEPMEPNAYLTPTRLERLSAFRKNHAIKGLVTLFATQTGLIASVPLFKALRKNHVQTTLLDISQIAVKGGLLPLLNKNYNYNGFANYYSKRPQVKSLKAAAFIAGLFHTNKVYDWHTRQATRFLTRFNVSY